MIKIQFLVCCFIAAVFFVYVISQNKQIVIQNVVRHEVGIFEKWHKCAVKSFDFKDDPVKFWNTTGRHINDCGKLINADVTLRIQKFNNTDEMKMAILPVHRQINSEYDDYVVTLGIGKDILAEETLKNESDKVGYHLKFFGADPMFLDNFEIFTKIGTYFPLAVSASDGFFEASVLFNKSYTNSNVFHIDLVYFLQNMLKIQQVDHLWMDNEYSEYALFPYFYTGGQLDQAGITVCQLNMEVHNATLSQKEEFKGFVKQTLADKRYALLKQVYAGEHYRLYMFNFENDYCVRKFLNIP